MPGPTDAQLDLARRSYVYDRRPLVDIAHSLDIDVFELNRIAREANWNAQRAAAIQIEQDIQDTNPLKTHELLTMRMLRMVEVLLGRLENPDIDMSEQRRLRSQVETLKSLAEASNSTIKTQREAHGLRPGTPSAGDAQEVDGVRYVVRVDRTTAAGVV